MRITALTSTKATTATESSSGVGLSVAFHSTAMPLASTASRKIASAAASGTAMIENTSITTDCSVPMTFNWLRSTPKAAPNAAPEKVQPNHGSSTTFSTISISMAENSAASSTTSSQETPVKTSAPAPLMASVQTWKCVWS